MAVLTNAGGLLAMLLACYLLVALPVCLAPTTIGGLLSAIGIAGMDWMIQANVIATSGRAVEAVDRFVREQGGAVPPAVAAMVDEVTRHVEGRTLGLLGEPRVNVLLLNRALDELARPAP